MIIKTIKLTNFRNHKTYHLECKPDTTLILGENGCGKTSVLEAIYILTRGKSFRATDPDILKRGEDFYRIEIEYDTGEKNGCPVSHPDSGAGFLRFRFRGRSRRNQRHRRNPVCRSPVCSSGNTSEYSRPDFLQWL